MIRDQLEGREEEIIWILSLLPKSFVLVGGYAVSALSSHRLSVDCDIVTSTNDLKEVVGALTGAGYAKGRSARIGKGYRGAVEIYVGKARGGNVSVDIFVDSMTARGTGASWGYEYIRKNSAEVIVSGVGGSATIRAPTRELLLAVKIHSGRDADMRDIVMLSDGADWRAVARHVARGDRETLLKQLADIVERMGSEQFDSSLRAAFALRRNIKPLVSSCRKRLAALKSELSADSSLYWCLHNFLTS
ncbi:MAG: nucleotidyl transferase AbiEii/AbiGii toxin family protein [Nitrososphaerota archaeon]|nr:nucleotidyl transferase AbiEii/AbiGii toxin family protein [Nitrososphaerota archaeon]